MKTLVTGHDGYIGAVLVPMLLDAGHEVTGLDIGLFSQCNLGGEPVPVPSIHRDVRDIEASTLEGFDAVIHLAAISNDPVGDLNPEITYAVNHRASVSLAGAAREAGVERFLFASSCSLYGAASDVVDESAEFNPVTPYGQSKVLAERDISTLASESFSPTFLRNGTAHGLSRRHRGDLVVNNLTAYGFTTGEVRMQSDGTPWRPLVHIRDIAGALLAALEAPRDAVHNEAFNVGADEENYQIRDVAHIVAEVVPGTSVTLAAGASPDKRSYRVSFKKIGEQLPGFQPQWTVRRSVAEMLEAYRADGLTFDEFNSGRFMRIARIKELVAEGLLEDDLTWRKAAQVTPAG
jgi:nucleoside-diphosphate-sugar epimerase